MLFLTILFFILSAFVAGDFVETRYKNVLLLLIGISLFVVAAFRPSTLDRDYESYVRLFKMNAVIGEAFVEPSILFIINFIHKFLFAEPVFLFAIYAAIAVTCKLIAIRQLSDFRFLSLLLYFSYSFILHDLTQIRAGVSIGFVLLCIQPLYERKAIKFLIFALLAIFFHYSALLVLLLWFLDPRKINVTSYLVIIFLSYIAFFFNNLILTNIINYLPGGVLLNKVASYESENGAVLNIFNSWQILRCILCFIFLWKIKVIEEQNKYAILFVKIYVIATISFVLLANIPTFAGRISDLFSVIDIVLLPCLVYVFKPRIAAVLMVIMIGFLYLILNLFYNKIIL